MTYSKLFILTGIVLSTLLMSGCATIDTPDPSDPWEGWNRNVQIFNDGFDDYAMKPVAKGYRWIMPTFADRAVTNVFSNIDDIGVFINDFLQGKFSQSGKDATRFVVNTTAGIGGLIDVASMIDLPKHREDFGQTLGVWGVPTGPYLVLPLLGPSSPRGAAGIVGDAAMNPISYIGNPYISGGLFAINAIDMRADNLSTVRIADEAAVFGRYEYYRDAYIAQRKYLVLDGNVPEDEEYLLDEDYLLDESFDEDDSLAPVNPY
ncbi:MAG: VacJ family lipoprotein [Methylococcales bacterium]|nr:VacJ family lipoprotein [Methylococcales bacterium]